MTYLKPRSADDYIASLQQQAREAFASHQIRHRDARSWACFKPHPDGGWDSIYWFEAVVLYGGTLLVNGDIDLMHFAHYGPHEDPQQVLRWMGGTKDVGYYVSQKAAIGMNLPRNAAGIVEKMAPDVWVHRAIDYMQQNCDVSAEALTGDVDIEALPVEEWLRDLLLVAANDPWNLEQAVVADDLDHDAIEAEVYHWGEVPSGRLVYAHEATRRLVQLLDAERANTLPVVVDLGAQQEAP